MIGCDARLLNISVIDGGYGLTINSRPAVRAKIIAEYEDKYTVQRFESQLSKNNKAQKGYFEYVKYASR